MATLEDIPIPSISEMTTDEAIEHLRQIRLSRRIKKTSTVSETTIKKKSAAKALPKLSSNDALELLKILGG